ncbi:MAG: type II toxin-antitoxin system Phd/YefM family antitoxin [Actinomycetota bacterium]
MKTRSLKSVSLAEAKSQLTALVRESNKPIILTRHGKPAAALVPFADEDDYFDFLIENDPRAKVALNRASKSIAEGKGVKLSDLKKRLLF